MKLSDYFISIEEEIQQSKIIKNFKIQILAAEDTDSELESNERSSSCNVEEMLKLITTEVEVFFKKYNLDMAASINIEWNWDNKYYNFSTASKNGSDCKISSAQVGSKNIISNMNKIKNMEDFLGWIGSQEWMNLK